MLTLEMSIRLLRINYVNYHFSETSLQNINDLFTSIKRFIINSWAPAKHIPVPNPTCVWGSLEYEYTVGGLHRSLKVKKTHCLNYMVHIDCQIFSNDSPKTANFVGRH